VLVQEPTKLHPAQPHSTLRDCVLDSVTFDGDD
jgi:hypothetical protein